VGNIFGEPQIFAFLHTLGRKAPVVGQARMAATALLPLSGRGAEVRIRLEAVPELIWPSGSERSVAGIHLCHLAPLFKWPSIDQSHEARRAKWLIYSV
jgi:hypothetical protein